ncbi:MAG TPA: regulatory protein RecX [Blastocatellia bacterium]|nr:regulatory protein RecX [Blastocatellia bacterium]
MRKRGGRKHLATEGATSAPKRETAGDQLTAAALKALAGRPRSEKQLREMLLTRTLAGADEIDECIGRLKELGFVDDRIFAFGYASSRLKAKAIGRSRLARELAARKVSSEAIEEAVEASYTDEPEGVLIDRAIEKRVRAHGRPSDPRSAKRMFDHLARLGFEYDLIVKKLRAMKVGPKE